MKRSILLVCMMISSLSLFAQVKKPVFMVFPSELYCNQHDYYYLLETSQGTQRMPDYGKCLSDDQTMVAAINIMAGWLVDQKMIVKDLSHTIKEIYGNEAEGGKTSAKPLYHRIIESSGVDIAVNMYYNIKQEGHNKSLYVEYRAVETESGDIIASSSNTNTIFGLDTTESALTDCIHSGLYKFSNQLMEYFVEYVKKYETD